MMRRFRVLRTQSIWPQPWSNSPALFPSDLPQSVPWVFVTGALGTRVARLLAWDESGKAQPPFRWWYTIPSALTALACIVWTYGHARTDPRSYRVACPLVLVVDNPSR